MVTPGCCLYHFKRPDEGAVDAAVSPLIEEFKATYGGDMEDDTPVEGRKRSGGGSAVRYYHY